MSTYKAIQKLFVGTTEVPINDANEVHLPEHTQTYTQMTQAAYDAANPKPTGLIIIIG